MCTYSRIVFEFYFIQSLEIKGNTEENPDVDEDSQILDRNIESTEDVSI